MKNKIINTDVFLENSLVDTIRLGQVRIAEEVCNIIHQQIHILSGLQDGQNQREYIADLYQAILDVARSFNDERIDMIRGRE